MSNHQDFKLPRSLKIFLVIAEQGQTTRDAIAARLQQATGLLDPIAARAVNFVSPG